MENQFVEATEKAIAKLVAAYQGNPNRYWNERDLHWYLFHSLKQDPVFLRDYGTELVRAEFPTRALYTEEETPARGHYDLVILDAVSATSALVSKLPPWTSWKEYLPLVEVTVAVEIKLWVDDRTDIRQKIDRDVGKLTDHENAVRHHYFLNFVQLDFARPQMMAFYNNLRAYLIENAKRWANLKILCVPHDQGIQPDPNNNWISDV